MENRKYNGKVILFGEYSMIFGSEALLIPYYSAFGEWTSVINRPSERGFESNKNLFKFYDYLCKNDRFRILDLRRFEMELNAGLYFDSNIPLGYGVGSSGALVAATYDRYKLIEIDDVGPVVAKSIYEFFRNEHNLEIIEGLRSKCLNFKYLGSLTKAANSYFSGKTCVLTGTLSSMGRNRSSDFCA